MDEGALNECWEDVVSLICDDDQWYILLRHVFGAQLALEIALADGVDPPSTIPDEDRTLWKELTGSDVQVSKRQRW
jgi:hypothetical protein